VPNHLEDRHSAQISLKVIWLKIFRDALNPFCHPQMDNDPDDYVTYHPQLKVVICQPCKQCIRPGGAYRHLLQHKNDIAQPIRSAIQKYCDALELVEPEDVSIPTDGQPVPGLQIQNGFKCSEPQCANLCSSITTAKNHARTHGWVANKPPMWSEVAIQVSTIAVADTSHSSPATKQSSSKSHPIHSCQLHASKITCHSF
jgi:Orsellinic acid/F9775 biosynthesis cluster protein D